MTDTPVTVTQADFSKSDRQLLEGWLRSPLMISGAGPVASPDVCDAIRRMIYRELTPEPIAAAKTAEPVALRMEARKLAAELWYKGVEAAVLAGSYDDLGDVVKLVEAALLRGMEIAALKPAQAAGGECPSCNGLNTSCPIGCERDPVTGELLPVPEPVEEVAREAGLFDIQPDLGAGSPEPTLSQIIFLYYAGHFNSHRAGELADQYLAALSHQPAKPLPSADVEKLIELAEKVDFFLTTARHERGCLAIKGAHYGEPDCDCGRTEARTAMAALLETLRAGEVGHG